jgi:hypothetical protein
MAKTAVGLFENSGSANGVVRDLTAKGFLQKDSTHLSVRQPLPYHADQFNGSDDRDPRIVKGSLCNRSHRRAARPQPIPA